MTAQSVEPDVNETIREVAKWLLRLTNRTNGWLMKELGLKESTYYNRLNGTNDFEFVEVYRMAQAFGVSLSDMCTPPESWPTERVVELSRLPFLASRKATTKGTRARRLGRSDTSQYVKYSRVA